MGWAELQAFLPISLTIYSAGLAGVISGVMGSLDAEEVRKLFSDPQSEDTGRLQLFALQYYLYLGLLQGLLVYQACLLSMVLAAPIVVLTTLRARHATTRAQDYS